MEFYKRDEYFCPPYQKQSVKFAAYLSVFFGNVNVPDRSKTILLLWFYLFYVLNFVLFEPYVRFHSFSEVLVTVWPPIGK